MQHGFNPKTFGSWQYFSCPCDACINHWTIRDLKIVQLQYLSFYLNTFQLYLVVNIPWLSRGSLTQWLLEEGVIEVHNSHTFMITRFTECLILRLLVWWEHTGLCSISLDLAQVTWSYTWSQSKEKDVVSWFRPMCMYCKPTTIV